MAETELLRQQWLQALGIPVWQARDKVDGLTGQWLQRGEGKGYVWLLGPDNPELWYRQQRLSPLLLSLWQALDLVSVQQSVLLLGRDLQAESAQSLIAPWSVDERVGLGLTGPDCLDLGYRPDCRQLTAQWQRKQSLCWQLWPLKA